MALPPASERRARDLHPLSLIPYPHLMLIYGLNPVLEALRAARVRSLQVSARDDRRVREVLSHAARLRIPVERVDHSVLDRLTRGAAHQGVVARCEEPGAWSVEDLVRHARGVPLLVVLDGVEDPRNLGAVVRACDAAGVDGIVRQSRHAAPLDGAAAKASAGSLAYARIAEVVNVARVVEELKSLAVWTVGLSAEAIASYTAVDYRQPTAFVLGAEGSGLRRLVRERCDLMVSIPMQGHVASLNVAVAAGVVLFEAVRQRGASEGPPGRK